MWDFWNLAHHHFRDNWSTFIAIPQLGESYSAFLHCRCNVFCLFLNRIMFVLVGVLFSPSLQRDSTWIADGSKQCLLGPKALEFFSSTWEHCFRLFLFDCPNRDPSKICQLHLLSCNIFFKEKWSTPKSIPKELKWCNKIMTNTSTIFMLS